VPADSLTPGQLGALLEVDSSTLRRWARRFAAHLSEQAAAKGQRRSYTRQDMGTLTRARDLLRAGKTVSEVDQLLATVQEESAGVPAVAAVQLPAIVAELEEARQALRTLVSRVAELGSEQEADRARIADLESRLAAYERQGWLARMFRRKSR